ncbi:MAG TPA: hypothetical protein DCX07_11695, partial [Phycisphaerales bacterium]|nr:hypothetical protein [Phycisphaerales bacterium]
GLSLKRAQWAAEDGDTSGGEQAGEPRRGGLSSGSGALGDLPDNIIQTIRQAEEDRKAERPKRDEKEIDKA